MDTSSRSGFLVATLVTATLLTLSPNVLAQSTTYYMHDEPGSNYGTFALKTLDPDSATVVRESFDFRKSNGPLLNVWSGVWSTVIDEPLEASTIPAGSVVSFTVWMRKTSSYGVVFPQASLTTVGDIDTEYLQPKAFICGATGGTALDTALRAYTFSCITTEPVVIDPGDRLLLFAGYSITLMPGPKSMKVELYFEGSTDSRVVAPVALQSK